MNVCVRLGRLRSGQIRNRAGTRSLITSGSGFTSTLHLLWLKGQWAYITGCCEAMIGCWRVWGESPTCPHGSCPWLQTVSSATYRGRGGERKHETKSQTEIKNRENVCDRWSALHSKPIIQGRENLVNRNFDLCTYLVKFVITIKKNISVAIAPPTLMFSHFWVKLTECRLKSKFLNKMRVNAYSWNALHW